ncbi:MAG TPA: hypothetical protein DCM51_01385 [Actinobacteria bacterium]|nr:hypothetical protein [Actinomycetota bacterium]
MAEYHLPDPSESILDEAARLTATEREAAYGRPLDNHLRIARIWTAILGTTVTPGQVALCMAGVKLSRLAATPSHRDSVVDLAGYARVYQRIEGI